MHKIKIRKEHPFVLALGVPILESQDDKPKKQNTMAKPDWFSRLNTLQQSKMESEKSD